MPYTNICSTTLCHPTRTTSSAFALGWPTYTIYHPACSYFITRMSYTRLLFGTLTRTTNFSGSPNLVLPLLHLFWAAYHCGSPFQRHITIWIGKLRNWCTQRFYNNFISSCYPTNHRYYFSFVYSHQYHVRSWLRECSVSASSPELPPIYTILCHISLEHLNSLSSLPTCGELVILLDKQKLLM